MLSIRLWAILYICCCSVFVFCFVFSIIIFIYYFSNIFLPSCLVSELPVLYLPPCPRCSLVVSQLLDITWMISYLLISPLRSTCYNAFCHKSEQPSSLPCLTHADVCPNQNQTHMHQSCKLPKWKHNRNTTICTGFAPTGQRAERTMRNRHTYHWCTCACELRVVCAFLSTHGTSSLPEGGGGREDNLAFIKALSSDLTTSFKLPWKQSISSKWCTITITGHNLGQNLAHLCRREIRPGMCSCGCLIWQELLAPQSTLKVCDFFFSKGSQSQKKNKKWEQNRHLRHRLSLHVGNFHL